MSSRLTRCLSGFLSCEHEVQHICWQGWLRLPTPTFFSSLLHECNGSFRAAVADHGKIFLLGVLNLRWRAPDDKVNGASDVITSELEEL